MAERAVHSRYDAGLKAIDVWLGRLCSGLLAATLLYGSARLPHYVAVLLIAVACVAVYAIFSGLVTLAQKMSLVGGDILKSTSTQTFLEDDFPVTPRPIAPMSVAADATTVKGSATPRSGPRKADDLRTVTIAGRGKVTYRLEDRRSRPRSASHTDQITGLNGPRP